MLSAGTYHPEVFSPGFEFSLTTDWVNGTMTSGVFDLKSTASPGDAIAFFGHPRPKMLDGAPVPGVESNVEAIEAWLLTNGALTAGPATDVTIGGLKGQWSDVAAAPGVENQLTDCPVQTCVVVLGGSDPAATSGGSWLSFLAGPERMRIYLLTAEDGPIAIVVDSLDGTTFDDLTNAADEILATVRFDQS